LDYVNLGSTGISDSQFCLGCRILDEEASRPALRRAIAAVIA